MDRSTPSLSQTMRGDGWKKRMRRMLMCSDKWFCSWSAQDIRVGVGETTSNSSNYLE